MLDQIIEYFSFPFVRNALVAGVLISLSAALLGVPLVLKRLSFIGDGLSHVAFGAMVVAGVLNFADSMSLSLPVTAVCALVLLKSSRSAQTAGSSRTTASSTWRSTKATPRPAERTRRSSTRCGPSWWPS